jgi:hypothetical protein
MTPKKSPQTPLTGRVALVAAAQRAGRVAASPVRSVSRRRSLLHQSEASQASRRRLGGETIDETATLIRPPAAAIALRVDPHERKREVRALFRRILRKHHRLDVVVDSVAERIR